MLTAATYSYTCYLSHCLIDTLHTYSMTWAFCILKEHYSIQTSLFWISTEDIFNA